MTWTELLAGISLGLGLLLAFDRLIMRLMLGKFATAEQVAKVEETLRNKIDALDRSTKDEQILRAGKVRDNETQLALIEERIIHMPGREQIDDMNERIVGLGLQVATNTGNLNAIREDVQHVRRMLENLDNVYRRTGR